jgi:hypothetical protein
MRILSSIEAAVSQEAATRIGSARRRRGSFM